MPADGQDAGPPRPGRWRRWSGPRAPTDAGQARGVARLVVVRQHDGRPAVGAEGALAAADGGARTRAADHGRVEQLPVEDEVAIGGQRGRALGRADEQLTDRHPPGLARRRSPGTGRSGPAGPAGRSRRGGPGASTRSCPGATRIGRHVRVLEEDVEGVEPEAVDAAVAASRGPSRTGRPRPPGPASRARAARPGTCGGRTGRGPGRRSRPGRRTTTPSRWAAAVGRRRSVPAGSRHRYQSAYGAVRRRARRHEPGMLVAGVVHDQVEDDPDAAPMGLRDQPVEVGLRAEQRDRPPRGR